MATEAVPHRGILLAGGKGTRLYPLTITTSKQLVGVFDKPMVYYPLTTMMLAGVREIMVISTPAHLPQFRALFGDGSRWGLRFEYAEQGAPRGIAEALIIAEAFSGDSPVMLMLGDNLIYGRFAFLRRAIAAAGNHATIFAHHVDDPTRYGVVEFDEAGTVLTLEEKPTQPRSKWAVPGLYLYPPGVAAEARQVDPSARGEIEITDLNRRYLDRGQLRVQLMGRGIAWFDAGTAQELLEAASFVETIQRRQGLVIGSPEEVAYRMGYTRRSQLVDSVAALPPSLYREQLDRLIEEVP